jgi:hypothetical protein
MPLGCAALRSFTLDSYAYACLCPELKRQQGRRLSKVEMLQEPAASNFYKQPPRYLNTYIGSNLSLLVGFPSLINFNLFASSYIVSY